MGNAFLFIVLKMFFKSEKKLIETVEQRVVKRHDSLTLFVKGICPSKW